MSPESHLRFPFNLAFKSDSMLFGQQPIYLENWQHYNNEPIADNILEGGWVQRTQIPFLFLPDLHAQMSVKEAATLQHIYQYKTKWPLLVAWNEYTRWWSTELNALLALLLARVWMKEGFPWRKMSENSSKSHACLHLEILLWTFRSRLPGDGYVSNSLLLLLLPLLLLVAFLLHLLLLLSNSTKE